MFAVQVFTKPVTETNSLYMVVKNVRIKRWWLFMLISIFVFIWTGCFTTSKPATAQQVLISYRKDIEQLVKTTDAFVKAVQHSSDIVALQTAFKNARYTYKKIEWLAEYYQPYTTRFINGPALQEVEPEDKSVIIMPEGFQVIEQMIFPVLDTTTKTDLLRQAKLLYSNVSRLQNAAAILQTSDSHIFDALRLELFRIISLGISGFDSSVAQNSIAEAKASLLGIENYFSFYVTHLQQKDKQCANKLEQLFSTAKQFLSSKTNFISFDRAQFIRQYANPLSENLLAAQKNLGFPLLNEPRALKADAKTLFAENVFNADFYTPGEEACSTPAKLVLGTKLFYDPVLSGNGSRSCASCHQPGKGFADAMKTNLALDRTLSLRRNTPGLLNAGLQPALFYDTRVAFLEDQAKTVITNKDEMHGSLEKAISHLKKDTEYKKLFADAYKDEVVSEQHIKNAIAVYVRSLVALNSRFDRYMRGQNNALNRIEIDGFNLFMGKAKCGTCHFVPLFSGSNPPNFTKIDAEVIGVPATADTNHPKLDKDEGKYNVNGIELYRGAFKTANVRNSALTAPYMHNGVFNTLEEVVEFYNRGGGKGLGLPIENQTLPEDKLNLTVYEKNAIIAFIKSLNDTDSFKK